MRSTQSTGVGLPNLLSKLWSAQHCCRTGILAFTDRPNQNVVSHGLVSMVIADPDILKVEEIKMVVF